MGKKGILANHLLCQLGGQGGAKQLLILDSAAHEDLLNRHHMVAAIP